MYLAVLVTTSTALPLTRDCSQDRQGPGGHAGSSSAAGSHGDSSGTGRRGPDKGLQGNSEITGSCVEGRKS